MSAKLRSGIVQDWQECRALSLRPDGTLVAVLNSAERELEIVGIELPKSPSVAFLGVLGRLLDKPMRCHVIGHASTGSVRAEIRYLAWQDKSGEVWLDLANTLIEQGFARTAVEVRHDDHRFAITIALTLMTTFSDSPPLLKSSLALLGAGNGLVQQIVQWQHNPDALTRSLGIKGVAEESWNHFEGLRLTKAPEETIKLGAKIDAVKGRTL